MIMFIISQYTNIDSLCSAHNILLKDEIILVNCKTNKFCLCNRQGAYEALRMRNNYHEYINMEIPFKAVFDFDLCSKFDENTMNFKEEVATKAELVRYQIEIAFSGYVELLKLKNEEPLGDLSKILILNASRMQSICNIRFSFHVHIPSLIWRNREDALLMYNQVTSMNGFDNIYRGPSKQLRCMNSSKYRREDIHNGMSTDEILTPYNNDTDKKNIVMEDYFVSLPIDRDVKQVEASQDDDNSIVYKDPDDDIRLVIKDSTAYSFYVQFCNKYNIHLSCFDVKKKGDNDNIYLLHRKASSICPLCKRKHDSENMWMIIVKRFNQIFAMIGCHRSQIKPLMIKLEDNPNDNLTSSVFVNMSKIIEDEDQLKKLVEESHHLNSNYNYCDLLEFYKKVGERKIMAHRAGTGTGKTRAMLEIINEKMNKANTAILVIAYRRSLTAEYHGALSIWGERVTKYSDVKGKIWNDIMICQIESITRIDISKIKDVSELIVFMDEIDGIIDHIHSFKTRNCFPEFVEVFMKVLSDARIIFVLDAYLQESHLVWLRKYISPNVVVNIDKTLSEKDITYYIYESKRDLIEVIYNTPKNDKGIIVMIFAIKKELESMRYILTEIMDYPEESVLTVSGDTSKYETSLIFKNVNAYLVVNNIKVLLYTSSVTTGINITVPVKRVFAFADVRMHHLTAQCVVQMLKRSRTCKEFHIYINSRVNMDNSDHIIQYSKWRQDIMIGDFDKDQPMHMKSLKQTSINSEFGSDIVFNAIIRQGYSDRNFLKMFIAVIALYGASIKMVFTDPYIEPQPIIDEITSVIDDGEKAHEAICKRLITYAQEYEDMNQNDIFNNNKGNYIDIQKILHYSTAEHLYKIYTQIGVFYNHSKPDLDFLIEYYNHTTMDTFTKLKRFLTLPFILITERSIYNFLNLFSIKKQTEALLQYIINIGRCLALHTILYTLGCDSPFDFTPKAVCKIDNLKVALAILFYRQFNPKTSQYDSGKRYEQLIKVKEHVSRGLRSILPQYGIMIERPSSRYLNIKLTNDFVYAIYDTGNFDIANTFSDLCNNFKKNGVGLFLQNHHEMKNINQPVIWLVAQQVIDWIKTPGLYLDNKYVFENILKNLHKSYYQEVDDDINSIIN